jgi:hypothetical protein
MLYFHIPYVFVSLCCLDIFSNQGMHPKIFPYWSNIHAHSYVIYTSILHTLAIYIYIYTYIVDWAYELRWKTVYIIHTHMYTYMCNNLCGRCGRSFVRAICREFFGFPVVVVRSDPVHQHFTLQICIFMPLCLCMYVNMF